MQSASLPPRPLRLRPAEWLLENGLYLSTLLLFIAFAVFVPNFLSLDNMLVILGAAAIKGIIAAGFTMAAISGLLDVSVIGVLALASVLTAVLYERLGWPLPLTLLVVGVGAYLTGLVNSWMVHNARINSFVATTATSSLFLGVAIALTGGQSLVVTRPELQEVFLARPLGINLAIWLTFAVYGLGYVLLNHTKLGAHFYAMGINYQAARLSGIRVGRITRIALVISAMATALAAVIATARAGGTLLYGTSITGYDVSEIFIIALLGGVSLFGGYGRIERNLVAALFLALLYNGLQLLSAPASVWLLLKGVAFIFAILFDTLRQRQQTR